MDWKIELIFVPVSDVDRAKEFYTGIGFNPDFDAEPYEGLRFVQLTPPGSACSSRSAPPRPSHAADSPADPSSGSPEARL